MCHSVGVDCVIVKSGRRICGSGAALASAPIAQQGEVTPIDTVKTPATGVKNRSHGNMSTP